MARRCFLDIGIGDKAAFQDAMTCYTEVQEFLTRNAAKYALPSTLEELDEVQLETLAHIYPFEIISGKPASLIAGRLIVELGMSSGLTKTRENFISLCRGDRGMAKRAPNKKLHFAQCPMHRIVQDFIAQGGDVTRQDGSGGESIYGGKFNDEKEGLKTKPVRGSLAMANSGKNSNTSQFFIVLTDNPAQLKKIEGKYVVFGSVVDGLEVLEKLNAVGSTDGTPVADVWIEACGEVVDD